MNWTEFFNSRKIEIIFTVIFLIIILIVFSNFLDYIEKRNGVSLPDPVLNLFNPIDLTWLIFGLIYSSIIIAIFDLAKEPDKLLLAIQSYSLLVVFRLIVMYVTPLNAPVKILSLNDPIVQFFGSGQVLTRDLYFSGHTATLFLLFLFMKKRILKLFFLCSTLVIGISVILQHVHYTVDVLTAPFFSYAAYRIVSILNAHLPVNIAVRGKA